jgi:hypothetical protein
MSLDALRGDSRPELLAASRVRWRALWQIFLGLWLADGARLDRGTMGLAAGAVLMVAGIVGVRRRGHPSRRVCSERHLLELRGLLATIVGQTEDKAPAVSRSTLGVVLAASRGPPEIPGSLHVSLSLPEALEEPRALCELAAALCPALWPDHCRLSPAGVLHLVVRGDRQTGSTAEPGLADVLYGLVLRRSQARGGAWAWAAS